MPRVKQNCPKKMKWEGGVEIPCTDQDEGAESSDGENSAGSGAASPSAVDNPLEEAISRKSTSPPVKLSVVSPELLMQSPRCDSRDPALSVGRSASRSSSEAMDHTPGVKRHLDSEDENLPTEEGILDFSKKKHRGSSTVDGACLNLSKGSQVPAPSAESLNGPLDLSCSSRKRNAQPTAQDAKVVKQQRTDFPKNSWSLSNFPFGFSGKPAKREEEEWNGKSPMSVKKFSETTTSKSLNELSKLGEDMFRSQMPPRQTAWQSHWVNKGSIEKNKEVFKCVWCKSSFHTLAQLTTHMKETSHCNSNAPPPSQSSSGKNSDLNLLIKETMPLPRKLVRGQDVWLGKGAEQTRQILKCMWCGQSFRSLAEMTSHMQQTQHYTNIISQEQIISWKSAEENSSGGGGGGSKASASNSAGGAGGAGGGASQTTTPTPPPSSQQSHVTAVLTCKVCDQAFSSLKDLSAHMVKNSHYKDHILRSMTETGGRRRQNREKRKKSLPVRKLLELERAQHEIQASAKNGSESIKKLATSSKISCEKCGEKIDTSIFVEHIRLCVGNARNLLKSALLSNETTPEREVPSDGKKEQQSSPSDAAAAAAEASSGSSTSPSVLNAIEKLIEKSFDSRGRQNFHHSAMPNPNLGSSILKRLGIDESADYTKPLVDSSTINLLRNYPASQLLRPRERSGSESSSRSQTPDRKSTSQVTPLPATIDENSQPKSLVAAASPTSPKLEPIPKSPKSPCTTPSAKDEKESNQASSDDEKPVVSPKNVRRTPSPAGSERSEANERDSERSTPKSDSAKSLNALSNMYDSLSGKSSAENGGASTGKNPSSHPLAALQKLCDYTDRTSANSSQSSSPLALSNPGAILAFTWACNDAVVGNAESALIKCAFCETPFISKGAYRHHLSKMHFVKDGNLAADNSKSNKKTPSPPVASTSSSLESNSARKTPPNNNDAGPAAAGGAAAADESPHSKFLKYTELAKQLSSKYV